METLGCRDGDRASVYSLRGLRRNRAALITLLCLLGVLASAFGDGLARLSAGWVDTLLYDDRSTSAAVEGTPERVSRFPYLTLVARSILGDAGDGLTYTPAEYLQYFLSTNIGLSEPVYRIIFDILEGDLKTHEVLLRFPEAARFLGFMAGTGSVTQGEIVQLTDGQPAFGFRWETPAINAAGTRTVCISTSDLTGENPDGGPEVFLIDYHAATVLQITNVAVSASLEDVSIDAQGSRVTFTSDADPTGGNPDGGKEVFLYDASTGGLTQISGSSGDGGSSNPTISGDGRRILFLSHGDLTGGNRDRGQELFLYDVDSRTLVQLTTSASGGVQIYDPTLSTQGNRAAFTSNWDYDSDSRITGFRLYLLETETGVLSKVADHLSGVLAAGGWHPALNEDGTILVFESNMDLVGENSDLSREIFLLDTSAGSLMQISDSPIASQGPADTGSIFPAVNGDGTRVAFLSNRDETGQNPDLNAEIFFCDTRLGACAQITRSFGTSLRSGPALSAKGAHLVFLSVLDLTGDNPDGSEEVFLFLADSNEKIGELQVDLDFDGETDFTNDLKAKNDFLAFFDTDKNGSYDPLIDRTLAFFLDSQSRPTLRLTNPTYTLDNLTDLVSVRATVVLNAGMFANPPRSGNYEHLVTLTSVDPDTGGADDSAGTAPLEREFTVEVTIESPGAGSLDVDGDGESEASTDGLLILRYLFGFRGDSLTSGAVAQNATRDASEIESFLAGRVVFLDVDDNQSADALSDGLLILRYLSSRRGAALIDGAIAGNASRTTADEIELALQELL